MFSLDDELGVPVRHDPGRSDQAHKGHFHINLTVVRTLLQLGDVTAGKSQTGLYGKPHRLLIRLQGLPQGPFRRKKGFQQADGLEKGKIVMLLKKAVF